MQVPIENIIANPYRDIERYPISAAKVAALVESIAQTDFWDNLLARPSDNKINGDDVSAKELKKLKKADFAVELAYGHHRLEAVKEAGIKTIDIPVKLIEDEVMLQIMANENKGDWASNMAVILETVRQVRNTLHEQVMSCEKFADYVEKYSFFKKEKDWSAAKDLANIGFRRVHQFLGETWKEHDIRNAMQALKGLDDGIYEPRHILGMPSVGVMNAFTAIVNNIWANTWPAYLKNDYIDESSLVICDESQGATVAICKKCATMVKKGNLPIPYLTKQKVVAFELWREIHKLMTLDENPVTKEELIEGKLEGFDEMEGLDEAILKAEEKIKTDAERKEKAQGGEDVDGGAGTEGEGQDEVEKAIATAEAEQAGAEGEALSETEASGSLTDMAAVFITSSATYGRQIEALKGSASDMDATLSDRFSAAFDDVFGNLVQLGLESFGKSDLLEMIDKAEKAM